MSKKSVPENKKKIAFFTMDVESFYDASFLLPLNIERKREYSSEETIKPYVDLLDEFGIKGTFFVLESSLDNAEPYLKYAIEHGHRIGLHGKTHQNVLSMSEDDFREQIKSAKEAIETRLGVPCEGYRAPNFGITDKKFDIIRELGFKYDSSFLDFPLEYGVGKLDLSNAYKLTDCVYKKNDVIEFKMSVLTLANNETIPVSGGGYLRLVPRIFMKNWLRRYIKQHSTFVFYVHPFEISSKKLPKIKEISAIRNMYLRLFTKNHLKRIRSLIKWLQKQGFEFKNMSEVVDSGI